ncbi:MAG: hypothetical protein LBU35_00625 [Holosporales bacterium]|nr:hypothetical protein [Holosporales bacterium]
MFKRIPKTSARATLGKIALICVILMTSSYGAKESYGTKERISASLTVGPMFSGKSAKLIDDMESCKESGKTTIMISYCQTPIVRSRKYPEIAITPQALSGKESESLYETLESYIRTPSGGEPPEIFVDECQFMTVADIADIERFSRKHNISINFYGLDMDFLTNPWPAIQNIEGRFNIQKLTKLTSTCSICKDPTAKYTARYHFSVEHPEINGERCRTGDLIVIEGSGHPFIYQPVCEDCLWKDLPFALLEDITRPK